MKLLNNHSVSIVVSLACLLVANGVYAVDSSNDSPQAVLNHLGSTEFVLSNHGRFIEVPNQHQNSRPLLKLSINGASVEKVEKTVATDKTSESWSLKLNDKSTIDFVARNKNGQNVTEYYFQWNGNGPNAAQREVCFHYGSNEAFWFSTYQSSTPQWPMDAHKSLPKGRFNSMVDYAQLAGQEFYKIVEHLFLNSDGFALLLDQYSPLFMRKADQMMCFSVNNTPPYMTSNHDLSYLDIKLHLFASSNIRSVTDYVVHKSGFIPKPVAIPDEKMFTEPSWATYNQKSVILNQSELLAFGEQINKLGYGKGEIMLDEEWCANYGNYVFNTARYPNAKSMIAALHKIGLRLRVQIFPISFADSDKLKTYFVKWTGNQHNTMFVDFSLSDAGKWFTGQLTKLQHETGVDSFRLDGEVLSDASFLVSDPFVQKYPNLLITKYVETVSGIEPRTAITDMAFKTQHLANFVRLSNFHQTSSNLSLHTLVANALSVSIAGYSFIEPYQIGGFDQAPSEEQYIRWVQATALMPRMTFSYVPWSYKSAKVVSIAKRFVDLHRQHAPTIIELAKKRVQTGEPIIRPMWYAAPNDARTYPINDQYMLGDDIVVAPVLSVGQRERSVYLPPGTWLDQFGARFEGPAMVKVAVPLDQLTYFRRNVH